MIFRSCYGSAVASWSFLTNHARVLLHLAAEPEARLRDIADALDVTERTAFAIVADLTAAGYVIKERDGRRNRYQVRGDLPLPERLLRERTVGELVSVLATPPDAPAARIA